MHPKGLLDHRRMFLEVFRRTHGTAAVRSHPALVAARSIYGIIVSVHLVGHMIKLGKQEDESHSLRAPTLNNTCKDHLLRVICDEGADLVDGTTVVSIRTTYELGSSHCILQGHEDLSDRGVV